MISPTPPPRNFSRSFILLIALLSIGIFFLPGCRRSKSRTVVTTTIIPSSGIVVTDLQSIADFLALPEVQELFKSMQRYAGSNPPLVQGEYSSNNLEITDTTIPGYTIGELLDPLVFCFGDIALGVIEMVLNEVDFVDAGIDFFIEGDGDFFTVYIGHKSLQTDSEGDSCEIHLVRVISAVRENDGSLSDLEIGTAVIGIVGACENLLVGDIKVAAGTANPTGNSCSTNVGPVDPDNVIVRVENNLVVDLDVFTSNDGFVSDENFIPVDPSSFVEFEEEPGFELEFVSLQPEHPSGELLGENLFKLFEPDESLPGESVTYEITNNIDENIFFAPIVTNSSGVSLVPSVNIGIPDAPDGWFCSSCFIEPNETHLLGYYAYDILGQLEGSNELFEWTPENIIIGFFTDPASIPIAPAFQILGFEQPEFALEEFSGAIELDVINDSQNSVLP